MTDWIKDAGWLSEVKRVGASGTDEELHDLLSRLAAAPVVSPPRHNPICHCGHGLVGHTRNRRSRDCLLCTCTGFAAPAEPTDLPAGYSGSRQQSGHVTELAGSNRPGRIGLGVTESPAGNPVVSSQATPAEPATAYVIPDGPKMLKETLCVAQARIGNSPYDEGRKAEHVARLQRLIDECDRHRPVGPNGKHGDRHTSTCGCADLGDGLNDSESVAAPVVSSPVDFAEAKSAGADSPDEIEAARVRGFEQGFRDAADEAGAWGYRDLAKLLRSKADNIAQHVAASVQSTSPAAKSSGEQQ